MDFVSVYQICKCYIIKRKTDLIILFLFFFSVSFHRENNIKDVIDDTFSVVNNSFGEVKMHELKPSGSTIAVTELNKKEYVKLYVNYRFMRGIEQQFLALQRGLWCLDLPSPVCVCTTFGYIIMSLVFGF